MTRFSSLAFLFLLLCPVLAQAQEAGPPHARVSLVAEKAQIAPNENFTVGIVQEIDAGWHTYWRYPGDSGQAMSVHWHVPEGFHPAGEMQWPLPRRIPADGLVNYGYESTPVFLQNFTAPAELSPGPVTLEADIELLVCADICIPERGHYSLTLNSSDAKADAALVSKARETMPQNVDWSAGFTERDHNFLLKIIPDVKASLAGPLDMFPGEWGLVRNAAAQTALHENGAVLFRQARDNRPLTGLEKASFLIVAKGPDGARKGYYVSATPDQTLKFSAAHETGAPEGNGKRPTSLIVALFSALFGGLILNLMPCVFPVLSIKILSSVKLAEKHPVLAAVHGLAYTAGIMICFALIAGTLIALKTAGAGIGWGFQLQNPLVVLGLSYLVFIIGLNMTGLFEIGGRLGNIGGKFVSGGGIIGSFFTGMLATIVATPCTAPFMGAAMGYALVQPAPLALAVFMTLGLGLALPYLLLSTVPPLRKILPKPGHWMVTFRQFLAFPMFLSAAWLVWVLAIEAGADSTLWALLGMTMIAFGFWLVHVAPKDGLARKLSLVLALCAFIAAALPFPAIGVQEPPGTAAKPAASTTEIHADHAQKEGREPYSAARLEELLNGDAPVFVEMTAAWCITCKVNEKVALNVAATKSLFKERNIAYLIGDWTNADAAITAYLAQFGRDGVPIYVYYGPRDPATGQRPEPAVLPQILTPAIVAQAIGKGAEK